MHRGFREKSEVRARKGTACLKALYKPQRGHLGIGQKPGGWKETGKQYTS